CVPLRETDSSLTLHSGSRLTTREIPFLMKQRKEALEPQWLQRSRLRAFEEPACPDAQAVMPRWQSRCVHREPCLACEWSSHNFAAGEHGCVFSAETQRLSQLHEVFCF